MGAVRHTRSTDSQNARVMRRSLAQYGPQAQHILYAALLGAAGYSV